jgi:hypothetical protein
VAADYVASSGPTCAAGEPITKAFSWVPPPEGKPRGVPPGAADRVEAEEGDERDVVLLAVNRQLRACKDEIGAG